MSSILKNSCLDLIKICSLIISSQTALGVANYVQLCNLTRCYYAVVFMREFIMIRLGSLERDYSLFRVFIGVITLDKG